MPSNGTNSTAAIIEASVAGAEHILTLSGYAMYTVSMIGQDRSRVHFNVIDSDGAAELQNEVMQDVYGFAGTTSNAVGQQVVIPASIWRTLIADRDSNGRKPVADPVATDFLTRGDLRNVFLTTISGRKLFITTEGNFGIGPYSMNIGDLICLFPGAQVPFVLRQKPDVFPERFELVGECYCHSLMSGAKPGETRTLRKFHLV